jgi:phosphoenolpyruvate synthase/pyruvate phosphate dikinase
MTEPSRLLLEQNVLRRKLASLLQDLDLARIPCDGVGLARLEFIMANPIRSHPLALLCSERVSDPQVRQRIAALRRGYSQPQDY